MKKISVVVLLLIILLASCKNGTNPSGPIAASTFYGFDASLEGWNNNGNTYETLSLNTDVNYIKAGTGSVKCTCTLSPTSVPNKIGLLNQNFGSNRNLSNRTVTIWVYVPDDLAHLTPGYFMHLNIERKSMPMSPDTFFGATLNTAGWNEVKFVIPAYSTDGNSITHDYSDVQMMYFEINNSTQSPAPADWTGNIYFDELSW